MIGVGFQIGVILLQSDLIILTCGFQRLAFTVEIKEVVRHKIPFTGKMDGHGDALHFAANAVLRKQRDQIVELGCRYNGHQWLPAALDGVAFAPVGNFVDNVAQFFTRIGYAYDRAHKKTIYLEDLLHTELKLVHPIPVFIETEGDIVIANYYATESYGYGDTEYEALDDLRLELVNLYEDLSEDVDHLGPLPQKWWNHLQTIMRRSG